jgi:hypothetical protein
MSSGCKGTFITVENLIHKRPVGSILDILAPGISFSFTAAVVEEFYSLILLLNANLAED